ncbi:MAG: MoxR family ATPase [Saprospiraceae bacterium]|nr:MoxR family ATPase [Saprospiraceae bacterium]
MTEIINPENLEESSEEQQSNESLSFNVETTDDELIFIKDLAIKVRTEMQKVIIGQSQLIDFMIIGLLSGGHILLEGVPGVAKTLLVKLMAKTLNVDYNRIQFTPDLMPSDVVGTSVFNMKTSAFYFRKGPVFSNFILIDEINRAPAKTQSALFEVMEERQITVDGETYKMDFPLFIVATQNPIEQEGTYKLPEAQLDRFIFKLVVNYPELKQEIEILKRFKDDFNQKINEEVKAVVTVDMLKKIVAKVETIHIKEDLLDYIAKIVTRTRNDRDIFLGASPRASLAIMKCSKVMAAINGRNFVTPDDIKKIAIPVLNHRIILNPEKELEGIHVVEVINDIIDKIEVPR